MYIQTDVLPNESIRTHTHQINDFGAKYPNGTKRAKKRVKRSGDIKRPTDEHEVICSELSVTGLIVSAQEIITGGPFRDAAESEIKRCRSIILRSSGL